MFRLKKLLGILIVLGIVFFIICDEKGYKIGFENNHIVFNKIEKKYKPIAVDQTKQNVDNTENTDGFRKNVVYKNSDLIQINYAFENPRNLRKSDGMNPEYLAKIEEEKRLEKERIEEEKKLEKERLEEEKLRAQERSKNLALKDKDTISSVFQGKETQDNTGTKKPEISTKPEVKQNTGTTKPEVKQNTGTAKPEAKQNTGTAKPEVKQNTGTAKPEVKQDTGTKRTENKPPVVYPVKKYEHDKLTLNMSKGVEILSIKIEKYSGKEKLTLNLSKADNPKPKVKNSNRIKLYTGFENPRNMRKSAGVDEEFLAKKEGTKPTITQLDNDTISAARKNIPTEDNENPNPSGNTSEDIAQPVEEKTGMNVNNTLESDNVKTGNTIESKEEKEEITYKVENYEHNNHSLNMNKGKETQEKLITIDKPEAPNHSINISEGKVPDEILVKIDKYQPNKHYLSLKKGKKIEHNFIVENTEEQQQPENGISDSLLESLLENDEINIDTLESENDEFLQKVFEKTRDRDVMNLIVETYLNEYQFVKAKRFIENLPETYRNELKPSLNLRVAFNSFALSSKNINENLNSILQGYVSDGMIMSEDENRYLGVLALMDRNYDKFFEISEGFTSENHKAFASKLQGYKDQIAKQMGMPDYYFDTLVSLELFNQGLFQPAKVLALYSLQQNSSYILPHQVLAYANFLTNSRDTSIEYLKKLVDIDPTNAEKYRFLMGVAYYWDEKYEQSVVMLSMIKDEKLRLDTQRYLINDYLKINQKNKLISSRNKMLGYENLVASDFYTYFYETFFHPYSQGEEFELYALDTELANKMLRVCSMTLQDEEKAVCTYGTIGRNIAMGQFDGMEQYLLNLVAEYPQGYLYQALGDYYVQHEELDKAKAYLLKAVSLTQKRAEINQIKKLLQETM